MGIWPGAVRILFQDGPAFKIRVAIFSTCYQKYHITVTLETHIVPLVSRVTVISCPPNNEPELSRPERAIGFEPRGRSCVLLHFRIPPPRRIKQARRRLESESYECNL